MKTVPILAVTNALALALAIFVYVKQGETQTASRRSDSVRSESAEIAQLKMEIEDLKRANAARGYVPEAASDVPTLPSRAGPAPHEGVHPAPLASQPVEEGTDAPAAGGGEEFNPQEMETFRKKVRKANELNDTEEQVKRVTDRLDELVRDNKIAPLNPRQKEAVATTVLAYRKKIPTVWQKLRASGTLENTTNEERGRIMRAEFDTLRTEAQRALEEFMPAVDAKTYLDDSMRETMRGGLGGGFGGPPPQAPSTPVQGR
jgi:hypothetical protein